MPDSKNKTTAAKRKPSTAKSASKPKVSDETPAEAPAPKPLTSADILQRKREAQRQKAEDESTTAGSLGRGPAAIQGRGPSGRTRGPVKK